MSQIKPINNNIVVKFEPRPTLSGLIIPERYLIQEGDETQTSAYGVVTDRRLINPQTLVVIHGNEKKVSCRAYNEVKSGQRCFVHYGAYEIAQWIDEEHAIIPAHTILFFLDPIRPLNGNYLGDEVFTEGERTASGIYITPYAEKKEGILIKITHSYEKSRYKAGDTVITIDAAQYTLTYENNKYVKLTDKDIIGYVDETGYHPADGYHHIKYHPDPEAEERARQNALHQDILEQARKHGMRLGKQDIAYYQTPVAEPVQAMATEIDTGLDLIVRRNHGCILPDGTWIVNDELIFGFIDDNKKLQAS